MDYRIAPALPSGSPFSAKPESGAGLRRLPLLLGVIAAHTLPLWAAFGRTPTPPTPPERVLEVALIAPPGPAPAPAPKPTPAPTPPAAPLAAKPPPPRPAPVRPQPPRQPQPRPAPTAVAPTPAPQPLPAQEPAPSAAPVATAPASASTTTATPATASAAAHAAPAAAQASEPRYNAAYLNNQTPYPPLARRLGESGKLRLRVHVTAAGEADQIELLASSGSRHLDEGARKAVAGWRFIPARLAEQAVAAWVVVPIEYKLEN